MDENLKVDIDFFFTPPTTPPANQSHVYSQLYLLRRDVFTCLGIDPTTQVAFSTLKYCPNFQARWPGIMTIMTGIDLLGQYYEGDDCHEDSGPRFKRFLKEFTDINSRYHHILLQLRNALIHTFGLYTKDSNNQEYYFKLITDKNYPFCIEELERNKIYRIGDIQLHKTFEISVNKYHEKLLKTHSLQENFNKIFPKHKIRITQ